MGGFKCVRLFLVSITANLIQLNSIGKLWNENRMVYGIIGVCVVMFVRYSRPL